MAEVSKLPAAAQAMRERLEAGEQTPTGKINSGDPPANNEALNTDNTTRVTLSKEEFNALQADRDRVLAAERRAEAVKADLDALRSRLTELEDAAKGSGKAAPVAAQAAPPVEWDGTQIPLSEHEKKEFEEDTIALMEKIATNVFRREASKLVDMVNNVSTKIAEVETVATSAAGSVSRVTHNTFTDKVRAEVAKLGDGVAFEQITQHQHWQAFLQAEDEDTGDNYADILTRNIERQKLGPVVAVFKKFYNKYIKTKSNTDGYQGALPSGATEVDTGAGSDKPKTLKYSDRQALHKRYLNREIKFDEYEVEKAKFDLADREGRLDYSA